MEKSEKRRFSMKPKEEPKDKTKLKRNSKMIKPETPDNEKPAPNVIMEENPQIQGMQGQVPIAQLQNYPMQPQPIYPYGTPVMINNIQNQNLTSNAYIANQMAPVQLKFGYAPAQIVCPYCQVCCPTKIEESFNCCTCFVYIFIIILIPILILLAAYSGCNNVNCNNGCNCDCTCCYCGSCHCNCCIDINHYCSNCGKKIGTRDTCLELCPCLSMCYC